MQLPKHPVPSQTLEISLFFPWLLVPDSVCIDSITWKSCRCLSVYLFHFFVCSLCPPHISAFQPPLLSVSLSVRLCLSARRDPLPLLSRLTFITAWPWLSLLSSLLWCSITLSSWGKHWCQATVMTFWLSVFMWWMRWKCTTTAKRGLASCQAATPQPGRMGAAEASARKQITLDCNADATVVICVTAADGVVLGSGVLRAVIKLIVYDGTWKTTVQSRLLTNSSAGLRGKK